MKAIILLLSLLLVACCGRPEDWEEKAQDTVEEIESNVKLLDRGHVQPFCKPYFELFESITGESTKGVGCRITSVMPLKVEKAVGVCVLGPFKQIVIKRDYWKKAGPYSRESTMLHELAHCVKGRGHDSGMVSIDGETAPKSIMFPGTYYNEEETYQRHRAYYHAELAGRVSE